MSYVYAFFVVAGWVVLGWVVWAFGGWWAARERLDRDVVAHLRRSVAPLDWNDRSRL